MPSSEKAATNEMVLRQPCRAVSAAACSTPLVRSRTRGMSCLSPCREPALFTFVVTSGRARVFATGVDAVATLQMAKPYSQAPPR